MGPSNTGAARVSGVRWVKNGAAVLIMLLAAAAALYFGAVSRVGKTSSGRVRVLVDGQVYTERNIVGGEQILVTQPNGSRNVILMTENGFYMLSANCHNQDCVHQGPVTEDNYMLRSLGASVICIPNRVEVQLILSEDSAPPAYDVPDA